MFYYQETKITNTKSSHYEYKNNPNPIHTIKKRKKKKGYIISISYLTKDSEICYDVFIIIHTSLPSKNFIESSIKNYLMPNSTFYINSCIEVSVKEALQWKKNNNYGR